MLNPILTLQKKIDNPSIGLPEDIFQFVSSITPLVNVDLILRNEKDQILLSWRDDEFFKSQWHFPGRILRFKNTLEECVEQLIEFEIGDNSVVLNKHYLEMNEMIYDNKYDIRSHFISFLYEGYMDSKIPLKIASEGQSGYLKWFNRCPENLVDCQKEVYGKYF